MGSQEQLGATIADFGWSHPTSGRRLNVLHVATTVHGDLATQTLDFVGDQAGRGWTVTVACPSEGHLGFAAREHGAAVRWWTPPGPGRAAERSPGLLSSARQLRRLIAEVGPDVVHLHGERAGLLGRGVLRGRIPTVYQPSISMPGRDGAAATGARRWERFAERWTTEVVSPSLGVDPARWPARDRGHRREARRRLALGGGPLAVSLVPDAAPTDVDPAGDLERAWCLVQRDLPKARLEVLGGAELVADLSTWLAAADVVVVAAPGTGSIGTPLVALQAMASARSVVVAGAHAHTSPTDVLPAAVGAAVRSDDVAGLGAALLRRLGDPDRADDEGRHGRRHVEYHHDAAQQARALARVYPRLVAAHRP